ncbi:hypothetical protein J2T17_004675 [Paenibacillus mucilaginosus]|uniref:hypothetical protein n=1 Tax=Paenibacillus mucilaginosus TaxID=61624 RepID=UPI003D2055D0
MKSIKESFELFYDEMRKEGKKESTLKDYSSFGNGFVKWMDKTYPSSGISDVTSLHLAEYLALINVEKSAIADRITRLLNRAFHYFQSKGLANVSMENQQRDMTDEELSFWWQIKDQIDLIAFERAVNNVYDALGEINPGVADNCGVRDIRKLKIYESNLEQLIKRYIDRRVLLFANK